MTCRVCFGQKTISRKERWTYDGEYMGGGIDACPACAAQAEADYQSRLSHSQVRPLRQAGQGGAGTGSAGDEAVGALAELSFGGAAWK